MMEGVWNWPQVPKSEVSRHVTALESPASETTFESPTDFWSPSHSGSKQSHLSICPLWDASVLCPPGDPRHSHSTPCVTHQCLPRSNARNGRCLLLPRNASALRYRHQTQLKARPSLPETR